MRNGSISRPSSGCGNDMNFRAHDRARESGFTILELIISMVLLGIMLAALFGTVTRTQQRYVEHRISTRSHETLGFVEQTMTRLFRSARADPKEVKLSGIHPNPLGHITWDNVLIRSDFNPPDGDVDDMMEAVLVATANDTLFVRWQKNGAITAAAYPVRSIRFEYYSTGGVLMTNAVDIPTGAARVKFTITVPGKPGAPLVTRTTWASIRN
jgi:prepilin-type N-terminal cleavage/methylation domain-containing protein